MTTKARRKPVAPKQLQMQVDAIVATAPQPAPAVTPTMPAPPTLAYVEKRESETHQPFGAWLLRQKSRDDLIGQLATGAAADRAFPKGGDPEAVRARLRAVQADGDMFEAVDDAELDWLSA